MSVVASVVVAGTLEPPVDYSGWWRGAGALAVVALLIWYAVLAHRPARKAPRPAPRPTPPKGARAQTLARIDAAVTAYSAGAIDSREAAEIVSREVRGYVGLVSGAPVDAMTLADLRASDLPRVPDLVAALYPVEFGATPADPLDHLRAGRALVATWD